MEERKLENTALALKREGRYTWLALFSSTGTLICCALPIALVSLGMGAAVAALVSNMPFLITLSQYKDWIFFLSGVMVATSAWLIYRPGRTCPKDPRYAAKCRRAEKWNRRVFWMAVTVWGIGFISAFLLLPMRKIFGW